MSKMQFEPEVYPSTRFAEGFYNGLKFSLCHALTFGIYSSKEHALANATSFRREFVVNFFKTMPFYALVFGSIYGMRQLVLCNRDVITSRLYSLHP